jgi:hypothetical protein
MADIATNEVAAHLRTLFVCAATMVLCCVFGGAAWAEQSPSGSYQASCKNIHQSRGLLTALCQRRDGRWAKAWLEHADGCQVAEYADGALRCVETRAQAAANQPNFGACYERCLKAYDCQAGVARGPNDISCRPVGADCRRTCTSNAKAFTPR